MAEFSEVMRQWRRMCVALEKAHGDVACSVCRLHGCTAIYDSDGTEDYADIERKVMRWAAEHPEPVYETWYEYLRTIGMGCANSSAYRDEWILTNRIPADIAEKLGIEPKEG